jgi:hypothetical protein
LIGALLCAAVALGAAGCSRSAQGRAIALVKQLGGKVKTVEATP